MSRNIEQEERDLLADIINKDLLSDNACTFKLYFSAKTNDINRLQEIADRLCVDVTSKVDASNEFKSKKTGWRKQNFRIVATDVSTGFLKPFAIFTTYYEDIGDYFPIELAYRAVSLVINSKEFTID
ncbi:hypothetical protein [Proteus sp. NMG38-2]|uniref:hypothetical protein n=1 Tax=Proteus sp. NMG38-2 TaxID=2883107 RepID=UPI001D0A6FD3|nr:hypothetical protein [Proteus sp. NMG38-2]UDN34857.1 hypothetical protein LG402_14025 [Proteus sp. NMG38-2]